MSTLDKTSCEGCGVTADELESLKRLSRVEKELLEVVETRELWEAAGRVAAALKRWLGWLMYVAAAVVAMKLSVLEYLQSALVVSG